MMLMTMTQGYAQCDNNQATISVGSIATCSIFTQIANANQTLKARDQVTLTENFCANNTSTTTAPHTFTITTDNTIVPNTYVASNDVVNGSSRSLNTATCIPGTIGGSIDVSPGGSVSYSFPIQVSPGSHGMQPSLGISYGSGMGDLGWGWHLTGLSSISSTTKTIYYDNIIEPIDGFNNSSPLQMDGQRLVSNGAGGFTLENNPYVVITPSGTGYIATSQDGTITEYGKTSDSQTDYYSWLINKITDANGNFMTFTYALNSAHSEYHISKIDYTGNENNKPYNSIIFSYNLLGSTTTTDANTMYVAGSLIDETQCLSSIKVLNGGAVSKDYEFAYTFDHYTKLNQISLTADGVTYNPTIVNWGKSDTTSTSYDAGTSSTVIKLGQPWYGTAPQDLVYFGDFNGDGITDVVKRNVAWGTPNVYTMTAIISNSAAPSSLPLPTNYIDIMAMDWNNDGKDEVLIHYFDTGTNTDRVDCYSLVGATWTKMSQYCKGITPLTSNDYLQYYYGDINGDNIIERIVVMTGKIVAIENYKGEIFPYAQTPLFFYDQNDNRVYGMNNGIDDIKFMDIDGDGRSEMLLHSSVLNTDGLTYTKKSMICSKDSLSNLLHCYNLNWTSLPENEFIGDFNGDGISDVLKYEETNNKWAIYYSDGWLNFIPGALPSNFPTDRPYNPYKNRPCSPDKNVSSICIDDIDGDGKSDIIFASGSTNKINIYISNGRSFSYMTQYAGTGGANAWITTARLPLSTVAATNDPKQLIYASSGILNYKVISFKTLLNAGLYVNRITDGNNTSSVITYGYVATATNPTAPQSTTPLISLFPDPCRIIKEKMFLPLTIKISNSKSTISSLTGYDFYDAKYYAYKGFLGFSKFIVSDVYSSALTATTFTPIVTDGNGNSFISPYASKSLSSKGGITSTDSTVMLAKKVNRDARQFVPVNTVQTSTNSATGFTTKNTNNYSEYYGAIIASTTISGTWTTANTTDFEPATATLFRPKSSTVTKTLSGQTPFSSSVSYTYGNASFPLRVTKTVAADKTTELLSFDTYGNPTSVKVTGGTDVRTSSTTYDAVGRFAISNIDALGYTSSAEYRNGDGAILSKTDLNGLTTTINYSSGGNSFTTITTMPTGITSTNSLEWVTSGLGLYKTTSSILFGNTNTKVFDGFGKQISQTSMGHNNNGLTSSSIYDFDGTLHSSTDVAGITTTYAYDAAGRITSQTATGVNTTYSYGTNTATVTNNLTNSAGQATSTTKTTDALGNVTQVSGTNGTIAYSYYSHGKVKDITTNGATTSMEYNDAALNQTKLIDPDAGTTSYSYNGFGQLLTQTDSKSPANITTCTYDIAGRLLTKSTNTGSSLSNTYYTTNGQLGLLASTTRDGITESYTYDALYRTTAITTTGGAVTPGGTLGSYTTRYTYNSKNQLASTTYPTTLAVNYTYDSYGYLTSITNTAGVPIWTGGITNNLDQWTSFSQNNGTIPTTIGYDAATHMPNLIQTGTGNSILNLSYGYNASGQMISRSETGTHITGTTINEAFTYDAQNRLTQDWVGSSDLTRKHVYKYSTNGNIDSSSIAGKYSYTAPQPHAVSAVAGIVVNPLPSTTFTAPVCNTTYNAENKIATIDNGTSRSEFTYGVGGNRYRCDFYSVLAGVKTWQSSKVYIGNSEFGYFLDQTKNYARTIIKAPTGVCAIYQDSNNVKELYYVHTDYQGSWLAITNSAGVVKNRYSYDAWGRPRNVNDWTLKSVSITNALVNLNAMQPRFDRGYTGHEMVCGFGLINMNGRLYDPYLQRFLSPDPYVQSPGNAQNYNRYSYCLNNPLMYSDPSGNFFIIDSWVAGLFSGGWKEANHRAKIDVRLWGGLFTTDPNKSFGGRVKELISRFTWQLPQTIGGWATAEWTNTAEGKVNWVKYKYGATVVNANVDYPAVTQGNFIVGCNELQADANNPLFQHEYGHYIQSQSMGWAFYPRVGIPSILSDADGDKNYAGHDFHPVEQDANRRAFLYFNKNVDGFYDTKIDDNHGWDWRTNPLDPDKTGQKGIIWDYKNSNDLDRLNSLTVHARWYDHASWLLFFASPWGIVAPVGVGLINAYNYNH